jgi:hypothetical protein
LFGEAGVIQQQHPIPNGSHGGQPLDPLAVEVFLVPIHTGEEPLEALLAGAWNSLGHSIAVLIGQFRQQASGVAFQGCLGLRSAEADLEVVQEGLKFGQSLGTGVDIHGPPPFSEEDSLFFNK